MCIEEEEEGEGRVSCLRVALIFFKYRAYEFLWSVKGQGNVDNK